MFLKKKKLRKNEKFPYYQRAQLFSSNSVVKFFEKINLRKNEKFPYDYQRAQLFSSNSVVK